MHDSDDDEFGALREMAGSDKTLQGILRQMEDSDDQDRVNSLKEEFEDAYTFEHIDGGPPSRLLSDVSKARLGKLGGSLPAVSSIVLFLSIFRLAAAVRSKM